MHLPEAGDYHFRTVQRCSTSSCTGHDAFATRQRDKARGPLPRRAEVEHFPAHRARHFRCTTFNICGALNTTSLDSSTIPPLDNTGQQNARSPWAQIRHPLLISKAPNAAFALGHGCGQAKLAGAAATSITYR
uniref:Uncharacterized protein n=1 Tax=Arundo donax TaxID=35708 RepID=A0A0A9U2G4_ARUDO